MAMLRPDQECPLLACLLALFVCRLVVASAIVPPWQAPDEPTHVFAAQLLALPFDGSLRLLPDRSNVITDSEQDLQRQILESMARHQWWVARGGKAPEPPPTFFVQIDQGLPGASYSQPLYYGLAAAVLRTTQPDDVDGAYWILRGLGGALAIATLVFGWAGSRLLFGATVAAGASAVAVLHPQFLLTAIAAHPDGLVNVCGALVWWQGARVIRGYRPALSLLLLLAAAGAALLVKRSALPLAIIAPCIAVTLLVPHARRLSRRQWLLVVTLGVGVVVMLVAVLVGTDVTSRLATIWASTFVARRQTDQVTARVMLEYLRIAVDHAWLVAGWQRFPAPEPWLWVARGLTLAGAAGGAWCLLRPTAALPRGPLLLAWALVLAQVAAIVVPGFWSLAAPQGRYLFAVLPAMTALLWVGIERICPARWRAYAGPMLIGVLAILDMAGFTTVLIPAYVPSILGVR